MTTDDLAGILREHRGWRAREWEGAYCTCGEHLVSSIQPNDAHPALAAHQAAVIAAAGWVTGPELDPIRTYYRSLTPDGKLWCESRDPDEVREVSEGKGCTFERYDIYEVTEGWQPWAEPA